MRAALLLFGVSGCLIEPDPSFVDPRSDLLIAWSFDDAPVRDDSGNGNELALEGAMIDGELARFDGDDDIGLGPDLQDLVPGLAAITLEARVRITDTTDDFMSRPILFVPQTSSTGTYGLGLVVNTAAQRLQFELVAGDVHEELYRDQLYESDWVTVHGVYDGAQAQLYVDGEAPLDPIAVAGGLDANDFDYGEQIVTVAGRGSGGDNLGCELASIRVWTRALSAEEVA
ncbi:MAG TPA: LamG-like jellyroll fold domain-containing protein [Nannocystaceae bacterium]|nr:LamG-like jellyroll fold domain-containing protein [Nannocystaceae bacterium]